MKVLVLGAGRMGLRHCLGVIKVQEVDTLIVSDINTAALDNARTQLSEKGFKGQLKFILWDDLVKSGEKVNVAIVAATAGNRLETCENLMKMNPSALLVEKPLGQSLQQVKELVSYFEGKNAKAYVNLNTRLYSGYKKLKNDLKMLSQFNGPLTFSISTGTIGIGANGIHYIDLIKYLTDAHSIKVISAAIDDSVIPSGRGPSFADFGGHAVMDYMDAEGNQVAKAFLILGSQSTVLGPWEIVGQHGRILVDEFEQTRFNKYRKADSLLPVNRYAGDYLPMETEKFEVPFLNDLTEDWLRQLSAGNSILPEIKETIPVHEAMFTWLNHSNKYKNVFPIT